MKKLLAILLSVFMLFSLAACGGNTAGGKEEVAYSAAAAKCYNMDLSSIEGYESYVVENGTWAETYDVIIALSKTEADATKRTALYHAAEDLLMETGCICPLYFYTDIYMIKDSVKGYFGTPLGMKYYKYCTVDGSGENININLASEPDTIDPAANSSVDGGTICNACFSGLVGYDANGKLVADCAKELPTPVANEDGTVTYNFELRDGLKWSDGSDLTAADFEYSWKRAATDAYDYGYLFEVIDGMDYTGNLNVAASEDGKTFSVTLTVDVPYFFELCAFPTFMPVKKDVVEGNEAWATDPATYVSNGAYVLKSWDHDSQMVFVKNENYWDAANVSMNQITNYLSDDDVTILGWFKNGQCDFIDTVPNDEIATLKVEYPTEFQIGAQLGTYYVNFNNNANLLPASYCEGKSVEEITLANNDVRKALGLLLDRNYICEEIGQAGQEPASSFVSKGITNPDGSEFYKTAGHNAGFNGYYDVAESAFASNCAAAVETLKKYYTFDGDKITDFPSATYLFNTSTGHQAIGEYIQSALAAYGVNISLDNQEWNTFLQTRKDGNYTIARNGWLADYNDAISYLDMWVTSSGNNDAQFGK